MDGAIAGASSTRRERWAWYLYDFGNSAYAAVVLLAVFSAYFQGEVVGGAEGSRLWGISVGIAMLVVAVTSPILGTLADFSGAKKKFLFFYTVMCVIFTSALFFATPGRVAMSMAFFILAEIGYRSAQVFYNGFLPEIATQEEMGHVSGNGWAVGTAGGVVCLLLILPLIVLIGGTLIVRLSLVITAVFFAISALPMFLWLPEKAQKQTLPDGENYISLAFKRLWKTIRTAHQFREFIKFMVAFLIYNDGVIMALDFAAIIGAVLFGLEQEGLIVFVIIVQLTNVVGAYAFGKWVDRLGGKRSLIISIVLMIVVVLALFLNQSQTGFFIIGAVAGFAMAGTQSVSRTMVGMFAPPGKGAEFYGFFAVAGRTSSFIGPTVYGIIAAEAALYFLAQGQGEVLAEQTGQRVAILSIGLFFVVGLTMLLWVNEEKARKSALNNDEAFSTPPSTKKLVEELEMEINNGGFDQFFFNSSGDYTLETIFALEKIGAVHTANIVQRAVAKFPNGIVPKNMDERRRILLQVSPEAEAFEELDAEFLKYDDNLSALLANYKSA